MPVAEVVIYVYPSQNQVEATAKHTPLIGGARNARDIKGASNQKSQTVYLEDGDTLNMSVAVVGTHVVDRAQSAAKIVPKP